MSYKKAENTLDQLEVPKSLESFVKSIPDLYEQGEMNKELEAQTEKEWKSFRSGIKKQSSVGKKAAIAAVSVAAACTIFVGSAFVSPAMAQIAAKIPYLNQFFESKPLIEEISEALNEKGYDWDGLGVTSNPSEVRVMILGSDEYFQEVKKPVENTIEKILKSRNFDAYDIFVEKAFLVPERTPEEIQASEEFEKISEMVRSILDSKGYPYEHGSIDGHIVEITLPNTENGAEDIKEQVKAGLQKLNLEKWSVQIDTYDVKARKREELFLPVLRIVSDGLTAKKQFHVKHVGYTNKTAFTLTITLNVNENDSSAEKALADIEKELQEFMNNEQTKSMVKNEPYSIEILSKDGKVLKTLKPAP